MAVSSSESQHGVVREERTRDAVHLCAHAGGSRRIDRVVREISFRVQRGLANGYRNFDIDVSAVQDADTRLLAGLIHAKRDCMDDHANLHIVASAELQRLAEVCRVTHLLLDGDHEHAS